MELGITERVALVTGGSAGIGRATALALAPECRRVAITYHENQDAAEEVAETMRAAGCDAMTVPYDLCDDRSIRSAVASVVDRWGRLDILVANAHYGDTVVEPQTPFEEIPEERWRPTMRAVLEGPYLTVKAAAPTMREQRWGRVVLVSSAVVELGIVGAAAFSAAKAGLHGLTRSLARELGPCGVLVNVVMPSMTLTDRIRQLPEPIRQGMTAQTLTGHLSEPEDVAAAVLFLCSAANGNVHGEVLHVTGGM